MMNKEAEQKFCLFVLGTMVFTLTFAVHSAK